MGSNRTSQAGSFLCIEEKMRSLKSPKRVGRAFEWLCRFFLLNAPQYKAALKQVWLWNEWPGNWGQDKGIDLVAQTRDRHLWAIQAKAIRPDRAIPKRELDSFLSESNRPDFHHRLIIATADDIGRNARHTIDGQEKPVGLILRGELLSAELRWPSKIGQSPQALPAKKPRRHQAAAVRDVVTRFQAHDRGQLIMACATGKTLVALWVAEELASRRTLVLVPSLSLISQSLREWTRNARRPFDYLVVCSDETVVQRGDDAAIQSTRELGVPVTTDVEDIHRFLARRRPGRSATIFCTYQSSDRIASAHQSAAPEFDLVVSDEAHRCVGHANSLFTTVLDTSKIRARKRLFMTATPRYFSRRAKKRADELEYELASMDDESRFGPVFHRLTFDAAVRADLLSDYRVVVIGVTRAEIRQWAEEARVLRTEDGVETDARTLAAQIGLAKAIRKHDLRKIISFHSSVARAKRLTDTKAADSLTSVIQRMSSSSRPSGDLWMAHISGRTPAGKRSTTLHTLGALPDDTPGIVSNCACLGEGADVPALDGVAFIDPKGSMVAIIQAVGRVMRKAEDKLVGTVVVPVFVDETGDVEKALSSSPFRTVWQVLRALRAHDSQLAEELDTLRLKLSEDPSYAGKLRLPAKIEVDAPTVPLRDFEQALYVRTVESTAARPPLTVEQILTWADAHHERTGKWPGQNSGPVHDARQETWHGVYQALWSGSRGLPGGSSLARLLALYRGVPNPADLPPITVDQILAWADAHRARTGSWPTMRSGQMYESPAEKWSTIDSALNVGTRGLPGGTTLPRLLAKHRGRRHPKEPPPLTVGQILSWADAHYRRTGKWPTARSGPVKTASDENWGAIHSALSHGSRGLPGGSSLASLLAERRDVLSRAGLEPLTVGQILGWADAHYERTGKWPRAHSGQVYGAPSETWARINSALMQGHRDLEEGSSLAKLLAEHRRVRHHLDVPPLTIAQILTWADARRRRTGAWPITSSGPVHDAPGETWQAINAALARGHRGLPDGYTLARLLAERRNARNLRRPSRLNTHQILVWADAHRERAGQWPTRQSGPVQGAPGETWQKLHSALAKGLRGLPGGSSLAKLLAEYRGKLHPNQKSPFTIDQILAWADAHHARTGRWPSRDSGPVHEAPSDTWTAVNSALQRGVRGLPGGSSLAKLLAERRGKGSSR